MNYRHIKGLAAVAFGAALLTTGTGLAQAQSIEDLDQKVRILERKLEIQHENDAKEASKAGKVKAGEKGFSIESADGDFKLKLRGLVQADSNFFDRAGATNETVLRRVRPIIEGTLHGKYDFRFTPDFGKGGTVIQDAYLDARFLPEFALKAGKFKTPFGIEVLRSSANLSFVEVGLPSLLVPNRDIGIDLHGSLGGLVSYDVAVLGGIPDGRSSHNLTRFDRGRTDQKEYVARLFAQSVDGLGIGLAGSVSSYDIAKSTTNDLFNNGSVASLSGQKFFAYGATVRPDGQRLRISPQVTYYTGPFGLLAEYVQVRQQLSTGAGTARTDVNNKAWQVQATYLLTGEDATYKGVKPGSNFGDAGWGALELAARYGELTFDDKAFANGLASATASARKATAWTLGANWYLNPNVKFVLNYEHTAYKAYNNATLALKDENTVASRFQIAF